MKPTEKPLVSKLNHWKRLIDLLEKNTNIAAVTCICIEPIYPPIVRDGKKYVHRAKVTCVIGTPLVKEDPKTIYSANICLEHQDECLWEFVPCSDIRV